MTRSAGSERTSLTGLRTDFRTARHLDRVRKIHTGFVNSLGLHAFLATSRRPSSNCEHRKAGLLSFRHPDFSTGEQNVDGCVAQALEIVLDLFTVWIARHTTVG